MAINNQKPKMTHSDIEQVRRIRGRSMLLFITDRCPVGCGHCSVDSRPDSPTISDFKLFEEILEWLCANSEIKVVGISGGEPFVERRGLTFASHRLANAGKLQVIYTSGIWATEAAPPRWIRDVLEQCSCAYLSTDAFHAKVIKDDRFLRAAHAIAAANTWIVVQVIDHEKMIDRAERLLREAFGENYTDFAELNITVPLTNGRGANVFSRTTYLPGQEYGPCPLVKSPMIRYDGLVTGCCNESVIMNFGPSRLRHQAKSIEDLASAVEWFHADPMLRAIGGVGLGALTEHPHFVDLAKENFVSNCDLCWKMLDRLPKEVEPDRLIKAISTLA
jgi:organic radical activating enzyme